MTDKGLREFGWWLAHPRLYRLIGVRWLRWRYPGVGLPVPNPSPETVASAVALGRELAERHGWREQP